MRTAVRVVVLGVVPSLLVASLVWANGGPFVIKYPEGDPAAKGVLARLDLDLKPKIEDRLRVVKEDLTVTIDPPPALPKPPAMPKPVVQGKDVPAPAGGGPDVALADSANLTPLAHVSAAYTIENPTDKEVVVDFGFPILRGVYVRWGMMPYPDVQVTLDKDRVQPTLITNSTIYGIIRQRARAKIDNAISDDADLKKLAEAVKSAKPDDLAGAKANLVKYVLNKKTDWKESDATLLAEYASLELGKQPAYAADASPFSEWGVGSEVTRMNLGMLAAIGEQKATQFFAQLAGKFDAKAGATYEAIFSAWGGDVKEQAVDLTTGKVRPREITIDPAKLNDRVGRYGRYGEDAVGSDPTVYTRVDYLDEKSLATDKDSTAEAKIASCKAILKNLPVTFTFAPMNLVHYQAKFPAKATRLLTVSYGQYLFRDTAAPASFQLAYVVHPASLWKEFGLINLAVNVPKGVTMRASAECKLDAGESAVQPQQPNAAPAVAAPTTPPGVPMDAYRTVLKEKTGDLLIAINSAEWLKQIKEAPAPAAPSKVGVKEK